MYFETLTTKPIMKTRYSFLLIISLSLLILSCSKNNSGGGTNPPGPNPPVIAPPAGFGYYVVGYFPSYRSVADVPDVKFRMCNVIVYAFFSVNATGTLTVNSPS